MNGEKQTTWVAGRTGANMLGWGYFFSRREFAKWNIQCRIVLKNSRFQIECCLEDVESCLKTGGMKRIEARSRNQVNINFAFVAEMPDDPIGTKGVTEILDVCRQRVQKLVKDGKLKLFKIAGKKEHFFSEAEVRALKRNINAWKLEQIMRHEDLVEIRDSDWILTERYLKKRQRGKRVEFQDLRKFERGLGLMITTREAAFYLGVSTQVVSSLINRGALKAILERPYWGGEKRKLLLVSDVKALLRDKSRTDRRKRWEESNRQRDWREETRKKYLGEKPTPFIHKIKPKPDSPQLEKRVVPKGPPEWTYSLSRDWTAYTYEVEARIRRTMKPQW